MHSILVTSLSVHWTVVFAFGAKEAAGLAAQQPVLAAALATAHSLAAALFLWTALAAWGRGAAEGDDGDVARLAFAFAALVLASAAALAGLAGRPPPLGAVAMQLAALGVTWLVIRAEEAPARRPRSADRSGALARRLALGAAHGSMLSRLSGRGPSSPEAGR